MFDPTQKIFTRPRLDEFAERGDQIVALELPFVAVAGGKRQQRRTPVPEDRDAQLVAEPGRVPVMMFDVHTLIGFYVTPHGCDVR